MVEAEVAPAIAELMHLADKLTAIAHIDWHIPCP
jgi:hypothetical protein